MKEVGIREVQIYLTTLLKDLPFAITRYGKIIAYVEEFKNDAIFAINGTEEPQKFDSRIEKEINAPKAKYIKEHAGRVKCKHGNIPGLCKYTKCRKT